MKLSFGCQVQSTGNVALTRPICLPQFEYEWVPNKFPMKDYCDFTVYKQIFILYWKRTSVHSSIITVKTNKWLYSQTDWDSFCYRTHPPVLGLPGFHSAVIPGPEVWNGAGREAVTHLQQASWGLCVHQNSQASSSVCPFPPCLWRVLLFVLWK